MTSLILFITFILLSLTCFIVSILFIYQKKKIAYFETIENLKFDHEKNILKTQLEMQEQTFQHISREIHDNISLSLTLAKLNLNTLDWYHPTKAKNQIDSSLEQISKAIADLSDISKSLSSELIINQGLIQALEKEISKIREANLFKLDYKISGETVFMESQKELIIFRIIQEGFNNIIKHANATSVELKLYYNTDHIEVSVSDNGKGFSKIALEDLLSKNAKAGISNMEKRAALFNSHIEIESSPGKGTHISLKMPYK